MDEFEGQYFPPVFLVCITEWTKALPAIVGEKEGEKFQVRVVLESDILSYDPISRRFKLHPPTGKVS